MVTQSKPNQSTVLGGTPPLKKPSTPAPMSKPNQSTPFGSPPLKKSSGSSGGRRSSQSTSSQQSSISPTGEAITPPLAPPTIKSSTISAQLGSSKTSGTRTDLTPTANIPFDLSPERNFGGIASMPTQRKKGEFVELGFGQVVGGTFGALSGFASGRQSFSQGFEPLRGFGSPRYQETLSLSDRSFLETTRPFETGQKGTISSAPLIDTSSLTYGELRTIQQAEAGVPISLIGLPDTVKVKRIEEDIVRQESSRIQSTYQGLVDEGILSPEQANIMAEREFTDVTSTRFATETGNLFDSLNRAETRLTRNIGETSGDRLIRGIEVGLPVAGLVATSVIPSVGVQALGAGIIGGLGTIQTTRGILDSNLTGGQRALSIGIGLTSLGVSGLAARSAFGVTPTSLLARQSQRDILASLESQPFVITGEEVFKGTKGGLFKIDAGRVVEGGRGIQRFTLDAPTFQIGDDGLARVVGGKGTVRTLVRDVISDVPLISEKSFVFGTQTTATGTSARGLGSFGTALGVVADRPLQTQFGKGFIRFRGSDTFSGFNFGGISERKGNILKVVGIEPTTSLSKQVGGSLYGREVFGVDVLNFYPKTQLSKVRGRVSGAGVIRLRGESVGDLGSNYGTNLGTQSITRLSSSFAPQVSGVLKEASRGSTRSILDSGGQQRLIPVTTRVTGRVARQDSALDIRSLNNNDIRVTQRYSSSQLLNIKPSSVLGTSSRVVTRALIASPLVSSTRSGIISRSSTRSFSVPSFAFRTNQIIRTQPRLSLGSSAIATTSALTTGFGGIGRFGFTGFGATGDLSLKSFRGFGGGLKGSFSPRYTPSFTASSLGLFGRVSRRARTTGIVTPFERRYILGGNRRSSKRKRKK